MLGAAMAASCFVSAFALAEQTPQKLSAEAVKQAVDKALKSGGKLDAAKVPASLKQKLQAAKSGQSKAVTQSVKSAPFNTVVGELKKPGQAELKSAAVAAFVPLFPTLDINTLYTITGVAQGEEFAYHFNLPENARIQVQLVNQSADPVSGRRPGQPERGGFLGCGGQCRRVSQRCAAGR
jgi:hypothetical protein